MSDAPLHWLAFAAAVALGTTGCNRDRSADPGAKQTQAQTAQCASPADCPVADACSKPTCLAGNCGFAPAKQGTRCDNRTVCDGREKCDSTGRCSAGVAPTVDDGNACTTDSCDPVHGVRHEVAPTDDFDACTSDACDSTTGQITHTSAKIDDGDDCTRDSCNPSSGVRHERSNAFYTCQASCGSGFHPAARAPNPECGSPHALRSFCVPDCGSSFHTCYVSCPEGYHSSSRAMNQQCGERATLQAFCQKNSDPSFYTCDETCPAGYQRRSQAGAAQCGTPQALMTFCSRG